MRVFSCPANPVAVVLDYDPGMDSKHSVEPISALLKNGGFRGTKSAELGLEICASRSFVHRAANVSSPPGLLAASSDAGAERMSIKG